MHVLCTGGGTAGHVVPLKPVIAEMLARGHAVTYVGSRSGFEAELLQDVAVPYFGVAVGKLRRYLSLENVLDFGRVGLGVLQAWWLLRRLRPDVVCSKGGYVSVPVVAAAGLLRIPVLVHESDLTPGLANRLAMRVAQTVCVSFEETQLPAFEGRVRHAGLPVRSELLTGSASAGRERVGCGDRPLLLITGGSLGALALNAAVERALPRLLERFFVLHITGAGKGLAFDHPHYRQYEFVSDGWGDLLAAADLVVSRAGATTLFELLALRKPHLLVPLPATHSRGDQLENAAVAERAGYSVVRQESDLSGDALADAVLALAAQREQLLTRLAAFQTPAAAAILVDELERLAADP